MDRCLINIIRNSDKIEMFKKKDIDRPWQVDPYKGGCGKDD